MCWLKHAISKMLVMSLVPYDLVSLAQGKTVQIYTTVHKASRISMHRWPVEVQHHRGKTFRVHNASPKPHFLKSRLHVKCGVWTHDPDIKSRIIYPLTQPGVPRNIIFIYKTSTIIPIKKGFKENVSSSIPFYLLDTFLFIYSFY